MSLGATRPVSRKHSFMPGYGGSIQHEYNQIAMTFGKAARVSHTTASNFKHFPREKLNPRDTFTANDFYARLPDPRRKTNSKNRSNMDLGDPRAQTFETMNMTCFRSRELPNPRAPLVEGFDEMTCDERDRIYRRALERTTLAGVRKLESDIRMKIDQRTSGGPFALRKAFKYFDRDGSGDIDPDEFFAAMDWFGLQFTEDAVLGLFGLYDDDRGGSLGYYEFVDNIISSTKDKQASIAGTDRINAMLSGNNFEMPMITSPSQVDKDLAQKCFRMCDRNGSGKIELVELEAMFKQLGVPTDSDVMNRAFVVLDKNFDGEISFEEFWDWWSHTNVSSRARGGVGEQGRATRRQQIENSIAAEVAAEGQAPTQGQANPSWGRASPSGGFHSPTPSGSRRPPSQNNCDGGDVLANSPGPGQNQPRWRGPSPNHEV